MADEKSKALEAPRRTLTDDQDHHRAYAAQALFPNGRRGSRRGAPLSVVRRRLDGDSGVHGFRDTQCR